MRRLFLLGGAIALATPAAAQGVDPGYNTAFCSALTPLVNRANHDIAVRGPEVVDDLTVTTGYDVDCATHIFRINYQVSIGQAAAGRSWQAAAQSEWNDIYCDNGYWEQAIDNAWQMVASFEFADHTTYAITANCH